MNNEARAMTEATQENWQTLLKAMRVPPDPAELSGAKAALERAEAARAEASKQYEAARSTHAATPAGQAPAISHSQLDALAEALRATEVEERKAAEGKAAIEREHRERVRDQLNDVMGRYTESLTRRFGQEVDDLKTFLALSVTLQSKAKAAGFRLDEPIIVMVPHILGHLNAAQACFAAAKPKRGKA
ncbi:hypothetical protein RDV64_01595 [Acuticoccus sp. MNP-M23]|uniref:hypothetical protein n=1 Tax=Acuticoccus sp. MNP-M23 TaxID=3072793 RepID=UPI002815BA2B|nr:hypothetical protein [Acuticoccus sp. MNP-M23]WMS43126.1 hypothetical protein RDV64_01595 [Acuticoccus sp. MNP-M23]